MKIGMRAIVFVFLVTLFPIVGNAACAPTNAPPNSVGCQPPAVNLSTSDYFLAWQPGLFPGSSRLAQFGTSGGTVPLNNGGFTQSGPVNFSNLFQILGTTMIFPTSGNIVGTTDTQTLTNKTISAAVINGSTITNGTISGATISGGDVSGANVTASGITDPLSTWMSYVGPNVPTLAALKAVPIAGMAAGFMIYRQGYAGPGDGGYAQYTLSLSPCSLNAGAGDNGGQVKPTSSSNACWIASFPWNEAAANVWGAQCTETYGATADSTAAYQAAANFIQYNMPGGTLLTICPVHFAGSLTLTKGGIRLAGVGPLYYPGMTDVPGPSVWPPTSGPAIDCGNTTSGCIIDNGAEGVEIDHINFGNTQPTPPGSGSWSPTVYPYIIATVNNSNWQGLNIHDNSFTSVSNAIDLEGLPNYNTTFTGAQFAVDNNWANGVLNTFILMNQMDNTGTVTRTHGTPSWYLSTASVGAYQRAHFVYFRLHYAAAEKFDDNECFAAEACFEIENNTVSNNFGSLTIGASALEVSNMTVNQTAQFMIMPNGNGTIFDGVITNTHIWGDQSGFESSMNKAIFSMPSNDAELSISHSNIYDIDRFADIGCGTGCSPGGGAILRMDDLDVNTYSYYSAGQAFVTAPSGSYVGFGTTSLSAIRPCSTGCYNNASWTPGTIMGPGPDSTQAYMAPTAVGGGTMGIEGAVQMFGSGNLPVSGAGSITSLTGWTGFFSINHALQAFIQSDTSGDLTLDAQGGYIFLKINNASLFSVGAGPGGTTLTNVGVPPTSCSGLPSGTLAKVAGVTTIC